MSKSQDGSKVLDDTLKLIKEIEESYESELEEFGRLIKEGKRVCSEQKSNEAENDTDNPSQSEIEDE